MNQSQNKTTIEIVPALYDREEYPHYNDMLMFEVKNGQGRFLDCFNRFCEDGREIAYRAVTLDGTVLVQARDENPGKDYAFGKLAPGAGLEHIDCRELRQLDLAFRSGTEYAGLKDAFEKMKPFLSLLADGCYLLVDTYLCPTNGAQRFFWDITAEPEEVPAFNPLIDHSQSPWDGGRPRYLYPSKWPGHFSTKGMAFQDVENSLGQKTMPRAVAYALSDTLSLLLDGHYKAAAHAEYYENVPCLLILPHTKDTGRDGKMFFSFFGDVKIRYGLKAFPFSGQMTEGRELERFPVIKGDFSLLDQLLCYPTAALTYEELLDFLAVNTGQLVQYGAPVFEALHGSPGQEA